MFDGPVSPSAFPFCQHVVDAGADHGTGEPAVVGFTEQVVVLRVLMPNMHVSYGLPFSGVEREVFVHRKGATPAGSGGQLLRYIDPPVW